MTLPSCDEYPADRHCSCPFVSICIQWASGFFPQSVTADSEKCFLVGRTNDGDAATEPLEHRTGGLSVTIPIPGGLSSLNQLPLCSERN
ncbi:hypothetical protein AVEN_101061-1 [Araneus ventricosus]|uniref:Uncharacterized protein n=1 Tax=Araneus ventricosus TaxID=182803 RepID=A0A4Y2FUI8_ARAVE|nr:hypothetical protein AVEN_101061-1 [Araneus ventricosus]